MEEPPKQKFSISKEWAVSLSAIFVSVLTLFVYIYQARIMQSQQHASVWPYVEWTLTTSTVDGIYLSVHNKGVGPAIIKHTELLLDGIPIGAREIMNKLTKGKADSLWSFTMTVDKRVMAPGDEIRLFHMKGEELNTMEFGKLYERVKYKICYCSIYNECWTTTDDEPVKSDCK